MARVEERTIRKIPISECLIGHFAGAWGDDPATKGVTAYVLRSTNLDDDGHVNYSTAAPRHINTSDCVKRLLGEGDILLEASGGGPGKPVGRVGYFAPPDQRTYLCSNFFRVLRPNVEKVYPRYLFWQLIHLHRQPSIWNYQQQTTGIINLQLKDYLTQQILWPDEMEQRRIAEILDKADDAVVKKETVLTKLKMVRAGIVHDLLARGLD